MTAGARAARGADLVTWYRRHGRELPWRRDPTPYRVWVSEIMLQQTTVAAVFPRYERFVARFPDVASLARAEESEVLTEVSGLGYYRRFRAMHRAARELVEKGVKDLPRSLAEIRALPGIGDYTAGAISAIAFDEPVAAVDGNALRIVCRLEGLETVVTASTTKRRVTGFVESMIPDGEAAVFTQALFDLGATVCRPRDPECKACPLSAGCLAFRDGRQAELPVLAARPKPLTRTVAVALVRSERGVLFRRRSDQASRMPGFWEMPEVWCASRDEAPAALEEHLRLALSRAIGPGREVAAVRHTITKYRLDCRLFAVAIEGSLPSLGDEWSWSASPDALPGPTSTISRKLWSTHEMAATDCGGKPVRRAPRR